MRNIHDKSNNLKLWLQLISIKKLGNGSILKLLHAFGSIGNIFLQNTQNLATIIHIELAKDITNHIFIDHQIENTLQWLSQDVNNYIITIDKPEYPKSLLNIHNPPVILYAKGNIRLLELSKFAIVGTRHPTMQGIENAKYFAHHLAKAGINVVSGMAYGIDRFAHLGAITQIGSTIGVLGTGIDVNYPSSNLDVYHKIIANGLLLSEFPLGTQPLANHFPRRNRIIVGLALGCLVVESALDGGSMISANLALDLGLEVMAIPGSIHNPVAKGCHKLIKAGAKLVENIQDIFDELQITNINIKPNHNINTERHNVKDNKLLAIIDHNPINIDMICANLKVDFADICADLLDCELNGHIINLGNGYYQKVGVFA